VVSLTDVERHHILGTRCETSRALGGAEGAAAHLGMKRSMLTGKVKKLSISRLE